ncbi:hypothetical protein ACTFIW_000367 [Dictyostelium discoideum]
MAKRGRDIVQTEIDYDTDGEEIILETQFRSTSKKAPAIPNNKSPKKPPPTPTNRSSKKPPPTPTNRSSKKPPPTPISRSSKKPPPTKQPNKKVSAKPTNQSSTDSQHTDDDNDSDESSDEDTDDEFESADEYQTHLIMTQQNLQNQSNAPPLPSPSRGKKGRPPGPTTIMKPPPSIRILTSTPPISNPTFNSNPISNSNPTSRIHPRLEIITSNDNHDSDITHNDEQETLQEFDEFNADPIEGTVDAEDESHSFGNEIADTIEGNYIFEPVSNGTILNNLFKEETFNSDRYRSINLINIDWQPSIDPYPLKKEPKSLVNIGGPNTPIRWFEIVFSPFIKEVHKSTLRYIIFVKNKFPLSWIAKANIELSYHDIRDYIIIFFLIGLFRCTNIQDHWDSNHRVIKSFSPCMPFYKFKFIHRVIHCNGFFGDSSYVFTNDPTVNGTTNPVTGVPIERNNATDVNPFYGFDFSNQTPTFQTTSSINNQNESDDDLVGYGPPENVFDDNDNYSIGNNGEDIEEEGEILYERQRMEDNENNYPPIPTAETILSDPITDPKFKILEWLIVFVNFLFKSLYSPGLVFSFDDDLYKWMGKGGLKKYLAGKADTVGNILWKLCDHNKFIYHFEVEHFCKLFLPPNKMLNTYILEHMERCVPKGPYCFVIDAGILGSFDNALLLNKKQRYFIISSSVNRLKKTMQRLFACPDVGAAASKKIPGEKGSFVCGYLNVPESDRFFNKIHAIGWKAKMNKIVNFYSNIPKPLLHVSSLARRDTGFYPRIASVYNNTHNFVDGSKMVTNTTRNVHRARAYWRSVFNDILNMMMFNSHILYKINGGTLIYKDFILSIAEETIFKESPTSNASLGEIIRIVSTSTNRAYCNYHGCPYEGKSKRTTSGCACHPTMHYHPNCVVYAHNPHLSVVHRRENNNSNNSNSNNSNSNNNNNI